MQAIISTVSASDADLDPKHLKLWQKAMLARDQLNWEYAISLCLPVVKECPMFLEARVLLRAAEGQWAKLQKKGFFGGGSWTGVSFRSQKKDPMEAINDLEDNVFQKDPFNLKANLEFYDLAICAGLPELAAFGLETIRAGHPANTKVAHQLAEHYMRQDLPDKAGKVYEGIMQQDPRDMVAVKGAKDAAALKSIKEGKWVGGDFNATKKDPDESLLLEMLERKGMTPEQMEQLHGLLSERHRKDPQDMTMVKRLAELLEMMGRPEQAIEKYAHALSLNPTDVALRHKIEALREVGRQARIKTLEAEVETRVDAADIEERRAELQEVKREHEQSSLTEAQARVDRNPTDKAARFDLGQAFYGAKMYGDAIAELQTAKDNPNLRIKCLHLLGMCFAAKNINDMAADALSAAAKEITAMDQTKKEILYSLALLYDKMGRKTDGLGALKEIYGSDYRFRDVASRVESFYA